MSQLDLAPAQSEEQAETGFAKSAAKARISHLSQVLAVALVPASAILLLVRIFFGATIFDANLSAIGTWNDEPYYWHQIATFSRHGFSGGYYSYGEVPSASFSHFGAHGPVYPLIFGSIARVVGWHYYSAPLFHLVILTIAIALYVHFTRLRGPQMIVAALVFVTFWPLMFFTATSMEEGLQYSLACGFAIIFYHILVKRRPLSRLAFVSSFLFIVAACLLRPTWSFLFLPFFYYTGGRSPAQTARSFIKAGLAIAAAFGTFAYLTAPYPYGFVAQVRDSPGLFDRLRLIVEHTILNVEEFLSLKESSIGTTLLQQAQHFQIVIILVLCCWAALLARPLPMLQRSNNERRHRGTRLTGFPLFFHLANLGVVTVMVLGLYDIGLWRDYRTIAPHLLLSVLLLVTFQRGPHKRVWRIIPVAFIVSNLVFAPVYLNDFRLYRASTYAGDEQAAEVFAKSLGGALRYEENADPWCNTLLSSWPGGEALPPQILGVPAGIGVSVEYKLGRTGPVKSKYVLASRQRFAVLRRTTNLKFITKTSYGSLYLNVDARCDP